MRGAACSADLGWLDAAGRSLREGFFMFWETLWALDAGLHAFRRGAGLREP